MQLDVVGIRAVDDHWKAMKKIWVACDEAGIDPPVEVEDFFGSEEPDDNAVIEVELGRCVEEYSAEMVDGYQVCLADLPKGLTHLRFTCAY